MRTVVRTELCSGKQSNVADEDKKGNPYREQQNTGIELGDFDQRKEVKSNACYEVGTHVDRANLTHAASIDGYKPMLAFGIGTVPNQVDASAIAHICVKDLKSLHNELKIFCTERNSSLTDYRLWKQESISLVNILLSSLKPVSFVKKGNLFPNGGIMSILFFSAVFLCPFVEEDGAVLFHTFTQIPVGAGLGSSASFGAALVASVFSLISCDGDIFTWSNISETIIHGTSSGLDPLICTLGGSIRFSRKPNENLFFAMDSHHLEQSISVRQFSLQSSSLKFSMAILYSGISRNTRDMVARVKQFKDSDAASFDAVIDSIGSVVERALDLFLTENGILDFACLAKLISKNQELLSCSNPYGLDVDSEEFIKLRGQIEKLGNESGSFTFASKITGAGGGGCALYVFPNQSERDSFIKIISGSSSFSSPPCPLLFPVEVDSYGVRAEFRMISKDESEIRGKVE